MAAHSKAPISSAARIVACNGSVVLESRRPETEQSQDSRDGDAMHYVAATLLRDMVQFKQARKFRDGMAAPNGVILNDEFIEAANLFADTVIELCGSDALDKLHIEEAVSAPAIHAECWGTPDVWWAVGPANRVVQGAEIFVPDFKGGHRFVDAFENWQCVGYTAGILSRPEFIGIPRENITVHIIIVQPRNYSSVGPVRRWTVTADKLIPMFAELEAAYAAAFGPNPIARVNPECKDCRGRFDCAVLHTAAGAAMEFSGAAVPLELSDMALATELFMIRRAKEMLEARASGLEEDAISRIRNHKRLPGWALNSAQGREKWTVDPDVLFAVGDSMGVDVRQPPKPLTPKQARDAGLNKDIVGAYSDRPPGALKLEIVDEKQLRKVFSDGN